MNKYLISTQTSLVKRVLAGLMISSISMASVSEAAVIIYASNTLDGNVLFESSGSLDISGLTLDRANQAQRGFIEPESPGIALGSDPGTLIPVDFYDGLTSVPVPFRALPDLPW